MSAQSLVDLRDGRRSHRQPPNYRRAPSCRRLTCAHGCDARSATPPWARSRAGNRSPLLPSWPGTVEREPTGTRRLETCFDYQGTQRQGERIAGGSLGRRGKRKSSERATTSLVPAHPEKTLPAGKRARPLESSLPNPAEQAKTVVNALIKHSHNLPQELYRSLTWDRGPEMHAHKQFTLATDIQV